MRKLIIILVIIALCAPCAYAKPRDKGQGTAAEKQSAGERIGDEFADSVADVLTGEDEKKASKTKSKGTPPGLAKKDKTPPGWDKGKKTGWDKKGGPEDSGTKSESPIKQFVKKMFGKE